MKVLQGAGPLCRGTRSKADGTSMAGYRTATQPASPRDCSGSVTLVDIQTEVPHQQTCSGPCSAEGNTGCLSSSGFRSSQPLFTGSKTFELLHSFTKSNTEDETHKPTSASDDSICSTTENVDTLQKRVGCTEDTR